MNQPVPDALGYSLMRRTLACRWRGVLAVTLLCCVLGGTYVITHAPTYTSSAEVLIRPLDGNAFSSASLGSAQQVTVGLTTEANLVGSPQVLARAGRLAGAELGTGDGVSGSVVLNSQLIQVSCAAPSRARARRGAEAVAKAYLANRRANAARVRDSDIAALQPEIVATARSLDRVNARLAGGRQSPGAASKAQLLTVRLSSLQQSLADAKAVSIDPGTVVVPATMPGTGPALKPVVIGAFLGLLGLAFALALAVWRTWTDDRLDARWTTSVCGIPVWASLSSLPLRRSDFAAAAEVLTEEYRQLRAAVVTNAPAPQVITVAPVSAGDDVSEVSTNLAACLRGSGYDVTVVDVGTETPALTARLGMQRVDGLSDVVRGRVDLRRAVQRVDQVRVLPAGSDPIIGEDLYIGARFREIVGQLRSMNDYVVLVAPPLDAAIGRSCAAASDIVLLLAADRRTTQGDVRRALDHRGQPSLRVDGVLLSGTPVALRPPAGRTADGPGAGGAGGAAGNASGNSGEGSPLDPAGEGGHDGGRDADRRQRDLLHLSRSLDDHEESA